MKHAYITGLNTCDTLTGKTGKNHPKSKPVLQFDLNGKFIAEFESTHQAYIKLKLTSCARISVCCNDKQITAFGFKWKWKN